jgi:hypothetical protein
VRFVAGIAFLLGLGVAGAATGVVDRLDSNRVDRGVLEQAAGKALLFDEGVHAEVSCPDDLDQDVGATVVCRFKIPGWMTGPFDPWHPRPDRIGRAEFRIEEFDDEGKSEPTPVLAARVVERAREVQRTR